MQDPLRKQLGDFLRARRSALKPEDAGLSPTRRRRTPGLRREEVAELAGIGVDWYIRLEQGRNINPSAATIDALANALQLDQEDRMHLRLLSQTSDRPAYSRGIVPDTARRIIEAIDQPAYITDLRWDVCAWNAAAEEILAFGRLDAADRNTLISILLNPHARKLFGESWEAEARRMVAEFRSTFDLWAHDPAFVELFNRLHKGSPEFATWWAAHDVGTVKGGTKSLSHPRLGALQIEYASFQLNDNPALKLVIYAPVAKKH
ncbi:MAG: helix-turn-helix domain-containing protein [Pseudomonadales bacterium]|nr:helix-turn-helix domain-containing protein [Pseudomonadales bacterium]